MVNWFRQEQGRQVPLARASARTCACSSGSSTARALRVGGQETLFGWVPKAGDLDLSGLDIPPEQVDEATHIDLDEWKEELERTASSSSMLGRTLPEALQLQRKLLLARLS